MLLMEQLLFISLSAYASRVNPLSVQFWNAYVHLTVQMHTSFYSVMSRTQSPLAQKWYLNRNEDGTLVNHSDSRVVVNVLEMWQGASAFHQPKQYPFRFIHQPA